MKKTKSKTQAVDEIVISKPREGQIDAILLGRTPLIINRLSRKVMIELLYPGPKKNAAAKAANLKHDPLVEFRAAPHLIADESAPTLLAMPASAPHRAMASAALDMPDVKKAQIGRLTYITGEYVGVYGTPQLFMSAVRNSDISHTPDIRTRCIVPEWLIKLRISFVESFINPTVVINLLSAAGMYIGLGDWRNEKGAGNYGQFDVLSVPQSREEPKVAELLAQGRAIQEEAMLNPVCYNDETRELLEEFDRLIKLRGKVKKEEPEEPEQEEVEEEVQPSV